jgi:hypothetical protein
VVECIVLKSKVGGVILGNMRSCGQLTHVHPGETLLL